MIPEITRYTETVVGPYTKEFLVECPKCKKQAVVTNASDERKLLCYSCNHVEQECDQIRYNASVKRSCDNCGNSIIAVVPNNKEKVEALTVPCPTCGIVRTFKPRNDKHRLVYKNDGVCDPVFNLPLWFQCDVRGNIFWGYNREHLIEIRNYVSSQLRERQKTTYKHTTMVEKLPNFIKEAKNRDSIVKAIDKLLKK